MGKKNLADNPAVQERLESVQKYFAEQQDAVKNVILPVEETLEHILQELDQLEGQCGAASTIEHALHKAAEFVRLAKIDYKYL